MTKYYISGVGKIGMLVYQAKQPDGSHRSYIEAESQEAAIKVFKAYAEKAKAWQRDLGIDDPLEALMISTDGPDGMIPKMLDYRTLKPVIGWEVRV
jgi:hypothetical protein